MNFQRLDKLLTGAGVCSRSEAKKLVRAGRVSVNGTPAATPEQKVGEQDAVTVDGKPVRNQQHLYIMLNKPQGVVCATRDRDCETVLDLLPPELRRPGLFPAGRLDKDTEGFVLITDDGAFAHRILAPRSHVPKTYHARLSGPLDMEYTQELFASGMELDGGDRCSPARLTLLEPGQNPLVEIVIFEGMYHQIKRMFMQVSQTVLWLKRVKIGGLELDPNLASGGAREIVHKEILKFEGVFGRNDMQK